MKKSNKSSIEDKVSTKEEHFVGPFFIIGGKLYVHREKLPHSFEGRFFNDEISHFDFFNSLHVPSQKEEYSMHVRGRVIYDQEEKEFLVYADKRILRSERRKEEIRKAFNLGTINVVFLEDEHYTTLRY